MDPQWRKRNVDPQESSDRLFSEDSRDKPLKMFFFVEQIGRAHV